MDAGRRATRRAAIWPARPASCRRTESRRARELARRVDQGPRTLPVLLRELDADGVEVRAADVRVPTLDDVFLSLTGRSLREEAEAVAA